MNKLSDNSEAKLSTCAPVLKLIVMEVLAEMDIGVTCGHRKRAEQDALYESGESRLKFPKGKHNRFPSEAVDLVIYHNTHKYLWCDERQLHRIAATTNTTTANVKTWIYMQYARLDMLMQLAAKRHGIELRWGGKWQHADGILHNRFVDLFHWEIA